MAHAVAILRGGLGGLWSPQILSDPCLAPSFVLVCDRIKNWGPNIRIYPAVALRSDALCI